MFPSRSALIALLLALGSVVSCTGVRHGDVAKSIIATECASLDRWGRGDPWGYIDTFAAEITYFDPDTEQRIDGRDALQQLLAPLEGKLKVDRYEMINPKVQVHGDTALLTYNLVDYVATPEGETTTERWNSTEVYARIGGKWKLVHSHWSHPKPHE